MKKAKTFFCKQFKKILTEKDITQQDLAKKLGIAQSMISQWITGTSNPNLNTLKKLSSVLDVPLNYFLENLTESNLEEKLKEKDIKILQLEKEILKLQKEVSDLKLQNELLKNKNTTNREAISETLRFEAKQSNFKTRCTGK